MELPSNYEVGFSYEATCKVSMAESIFQTFNIRTADWGTESLYHLGPKIWSIIPLKLKKLQEFSEFKKAIRLWKPRGCPCRMCKFYLGGVGFIDVAP